MFIYAALFMDWASSISFRYGMAAWKSKGRPTEAASSVGLSKKVTVHLGRKEWDVNLHDAGKAPTLGLV
jgi:hypothetical protein